MAKQVVEQEKEHVSENPSAVEAKDTEHVTSSEESAVAENSVPPEENVVSSDVEITPVERDEEYGEVPHPGPSDEMIPHEVNSGVVKVKKNEKVLPHIDSPEQVVEKEGDSSEINIDMKDIEMDLDGIPVISKDDIDRIKNSGLAITDFIHEIADAKAIIKECRNILSESTQNKIEKENNKLIEDLKAREPKDEKDKEDIELTIKAIAENTANLPKYNKKEKLRIERRERSAIKHIATYQNVSRKNIWAMQKDGTLYALISATSNAAFLQAFTESARKSKDLPSIEDDIELKKLGEELAKLNQEHTIFEYYNDAFKDIKEIDFERLVNHTIELNDKSKEFEFVKFIDYKSIANVAYLVASLSDQRLTQEESDKLNKELEDIKTSLITVEELEDLPDGVVKARGEENEYISQIEKYTRSIITIKQLYQIIKNGGKMPMAPVKEEKLEEPNLPNIGVTFNFENVRAEISKLESEYLPKWEAIDKKYNEIDSQVDEKYESLITPYKAYARKAGLFNSFISYAFSNSERRGYYGRPESALEFQHIQTVADKFYSVIRFMAYNDKPGFDFDPTLMNVNSVSMNFSNIIRYFTDLHLGCIDIEWSAGFDPDSVLKNFYYDNKENLDKIIKEWVNTRDVLSHVICHNNKFGTSYMKLIEDVVDFVNTNAGKLDKLNNNKKIKNKDYFKTKVAFATQFYTSYKDYVEKIKPINEKMADHIKEFPEENHEIFDVWYKENCLADELEATKKIINSFVHLVVGCTVIYAFDEFSNYFDSRNKNKGLKEDVIKHLFSEFILESSAFKRCPKDGNYADFIKEESKRNLFKSLDFSLQDSVDVEFARNETIAYIFGYATESLRALISNVCGEKKVEEAKEEKPAKKQKPKKVSHDEMFKSYREKRRKNKKEIGKYKNAIDNYRSIIENAFASNSISSINLNNDVMEVSVCASKDTKVIVRIDRYDRDISNKDVKKVFEDALIDKEKDLSILNAYKTSKCISNDQLTNINEKWYYSQYIDGTFGEIKTVDGQKLTLSEKCRYLINTCLKSANDEIIKEIKNIISKKGIDFSNKDIAIKNNCKFDIKYFKNYASGDVLNNIPNNGNLNFFKTGNWDIITFELNYDIVNKK